MKKYEVRFDGGESRSTYNGEVIGVDYMLVEVPDLEDENENIELYAELPADDEKNYDELKAEILRQAKEYGYTKENFTFGMINKKSSDKKCCFSLCKKYIYFLFCTWYYIGIQE